MKKQGGILPLLGGVLCLLSALTLLTEQACFFLWRWIGWDLETALKSSNLSVFFSIVGLVLVAVAMFGRRRNVVAAIGFGLITVNFVVNTVRILGDIASGYGMNLYRLLDLSAAVLFLLGGFVLTALAAVFAFVKKDGKLRLLILAPTALLVLACLLGFAGNLFYLFVFMKPGYLIQSLLGRFGPNNVWYGFFQLIGLFRPWIELLAIFLAALWLALPEKASAGLRPAPASGYVPMAGPRPAAPFAPAPQPGMSRPGPFTPPPAPAQTPAAPSAADEIRKFKELLDAGVITQEEFDRKKNELLGL